MGNKVFHNYKYSVIFYLHKLFIKKISNEEKYFKRS